MFRCTDVLLYGYIQWSSEIQCLVLGLLFSHVHLVRASKYTQTRAPTDTVRDAPHGRCTNAEARLPVVKFWGDSSGVRQRVFNIEERL